MISGGFSGTLAVRVSRGSLVHAEPRKRGGLKAIDDATQAFPERRSAEVDQQTNLPVGELEIGRELPGVWSRELFDRSRSRMRLPLGVFAAPREPPSSRYVIRLRGASSSGRMRIITTPLH